MYFEPILVWTKVFYTWIKLRL